MTCNIVTYYTTEGFRLNANKEQFREGDTVDIIADYTVPDGTPITLSGASIVTIYKNRGEALFHKNDRIYMVKLRSIAKITHTNYA